MSKPQPKWQGTIRLDRGIKRVSLNKPGLYQKWLDTFKEGQEIDIIIKRHQKPRTTGKVDEPGNQNGYYWGVVIPLLMSELGYVTPGEAHADICSTFLAKPSKLRLGASIPGETSNLDRMAWEDLMERIRVFFLKEYEIKIPLPNEVEIPEEEPPL